VTDRVTITLAYPIEVQERVEGVLVTRTIAEVSMATRVKGRHMMAAQHADGPVQAKLLVLMSLCGLPREYAEEFDAADLAAMDAATGDEDHDLRRLANAAGLPEEATVAQIEEAIVKLRHIRIAGAMAEGALPAMKAAPLDGGDRSQVDGQGNGERSLAT